MRRMDDVVVLKEKRNVLCDLFGVPRFKIIKVTKWRDN